MLERLTRQAAQSQLLQHGQNHPSAIQLHSYFCFVHRNTDFSHLYNAAAPWESRELHKNKFLPALISCGNFCSEHTSVLKWLNALDLALS